ncbi:hypothetical protein DFH27DRAFT_353098 [Peziza echinospora]|nr:hypothetical protein DFH27DRAFT_353098 [Peziza echinospora]
MSHTSMARRRSPIMAIAAALLLILGILSAIPRVEAGSYHGKDTGKIKLTQLSRVTLRAGQMTAGRRVEPVPQLKCIGGDAKGLYEIDVMICKNMGSDYGNDDVSWSCKADMPKEFKLGSTDVYCEGYSNSDDPYVLKGSCGVEYRLMLTDFGYEKFGRNQSLFREGGLFSGETMVKVIAGIVFLVILSAMFCTGNGNNAGGVGGQRRGWGGGGGGGGGDGWGGFGAGNDPPPPYPGSPKPSTNPAQGWRPGFWTGAAAGAAGSALYNRATSGGESRRQDRRPGRNSGYSFGESGSGSGSQSGSFGGETHSSTGFGQTRRR